MAKKRAKTSPHLLVIRLSAMGDVAMTLPVLLALKKAYPEVKITLLTKPHLAAIFKGIEGVYVHSAQVKSKHKGLVGLWRLFRELKKQGITHVADIHHVLRSLILGWLFRCSSVTVKRVDKGRKEKKALTSGANKHFLPLKTTLSRYLEVFKVLGFDIPEENLTALPRQELPKRAEAIFRDTDKRVIGIAPFAAYPSKMYAIHLMEKVIKILDAKRNIKILLFGGGENEVKQLDKLAKTFDDRVMNVAGKFSFEEELALISNLNCMLAMDSGNGHLAANYGVPVVTVWGVTHPYAGFAPFNQPEENSLLPNREKYPLIPTSVYGNKCPEEYLDAINSIPPEDIAERVLKILGTE